MKGWHFLQARKGRLIGQGVVVDQVADGLWLCHFQTGDAAHAEVVPAADMLQWQLFPDEEERNRYLTTMATQAADRARTETEPPPPDDPDAPPDAQPSDDLGEHGLEIVQPGKDEPPPSEDGNATSEKGGGDES